MKRKHQTRSVQSLQNVTLGLDLGSNSIGWALIDQSNEKIIAAGSRIFPEGVDRDKQGGELSKNESRRVARGMRRQIRRRARRKRQLREALILVGLLPADASEQSKLDALNPYELRRRALDQKLTPHEFGRVLIHLNQRRGFLSNRKADKKTNEASKMLAEISDLAKQQEEAGHRSIGEHFAAKYTANPFERLRGKHTRREMFLTEFEAVWQQQAKHYPDLLTDELKLGTEGATAYPRKPLKSAGGSEELLRRFGLFGIIFFQRPMYWPKSVVGKCELNPKEKRCPRADRAAQKFRIFQEVNNLRIIAGNSEIIELTSDQRAIVIKLLFAKNEVKFDELRKKLGLLDSDGFNLEAGSRKKLNGMETDYVLAGKNCYGKKWHELPEKIKDDIVHSLIHDQEIFLGRATGEWSIPPEVAERLLAADLPDGYASLGRATIQRLLPHIEKGLPLMTRDSTPCAIRLAGFLAPWERTIKTGQFLPEPPDLTNPIVRQALYEVRKLINAVVREYGRPSAIHIEMAREIKGSATRREEMSREMRDREARRDHAADEIRKEGFKPTRETIDLFLLWEEQSRVCIYSGKSIGIAKLFGGDVAIDHILPYSRSLDDSLMNKVVCLRDENDAKGQRTPYEWLAAQNPQKYDQVLQRASRLPIEIRNRKRPRFAQKTCELNQFINRQLTDTAYIMSAVVDYVKGLGVSVLGTKGQLTAELRHQWGLNCSASLESGESSRVG